MAFLLHRNLTSKQLTSFREYTANEIRKLLLSSPPKTRSLDPLPTDILLKSVDILLYDVQCITQRRRPPDQPEGRLLSRPSWRNQVLTRRSHRVIDQFLIWRSCRRSSSGSSLNSWERIFTEFDLMSPVQSAYRQGHSVELVRLECCIWYRRSYDPSSKLETSYQWASAAVAHFIPFWQDTSRCLLLLVWYQRRRVFYVAYHRGPF